MPTVGQRRVGVTGIGIVGPTGLGKKEFWNAIIAGRHVVNTITRFDAESYACRIAAEIQDTSYRDLLPPRKLRNTARATHYALAATEIALTDAQLGHSPYEPSKCGVVIGTSLGGFHEAHQQSAVLLEKGADRVNPFLANGAAHHAPALEVAISTGSQGTLASFSTGCCASMHALGHAAQLVAQGEIDCCFAGGTEAPISPLVLATMCRTRELCSNGYDPQYASRPFDRNHSGLVLSEGSVVLIIEAIDSARNRGANIYAEILAHSSSVDGDDLYQVDGSGRVAARAIKRCLSQSGIAPQSLDYVCANGNSLPSFDHKETFALKRALGDSAGKIPVSSIKGVLGHALGAAAAFQVAAACLALERKTIPPTHNLEDPDPLCDLDYVPNSPRSAQLNQVLICSYGFGGINAYIALRSPEST